MAQADNQLPATQVRKIREDSISVTTEVEHEFCWDLSQLPGPHDNDNLITRFSVTAEDGDAYQYDWKLKLNNCERTLILYLESFSDRNNADNKIFVEIYVSFSGRDTSSICALTAEESPLDLCIKGQKIVTEIPSNIFTPKIITVQHYSRAVPGFQYDFSKLQFAIKMQVHWKSELRSSNLSKLCTDLVDLYTEKYLTDVTFAFNNAKEIKAHKAILMARSPVFRAMFENEMLESSRNRVDIEDVDPDTFDELIRYLYAGKMSTFIVMDKLTDLIVAADKYAIDELKNHCEKEMKYLVTIENAAKVFVISHLLNLDSLKTVSLGVIFKDEQEFLQTDGYKNMRKDHPNLACDMFETLAMYRKEQK